MEQDVLHDLRAREGTVVQITSTEGEVFSARVLHVDEEYEDVIVDILSTNQPEVYEQLDKNYKKGAWAIPFAFIAAIEPNKQSD